MDKPISRIGFRALFMLLVAVAFVFGIGAGATMYATGKDVMLTPSMAMVSHTEYRFSEPGQIIARIVDFQGNPVAVSSCNATIAYPNKTLFVSNQLMVASSVRGDYYYNFTTPNGPEGIYEYQATCFYSPNKNASVTNSFHLSSVTNTIAGNLTLAREQLTNLSAQVASSNATLSAQLTSLSSQLNSNTSQVLTAIYNANASLYAAIQNMNITVNLTPVLQAIYDLNTSMNSQFSNVNAGISGNFSVVNLKLDYINVTSTSNSVVLGQINTTSNSIYTYVTTTLTGKVDDALTSLGIINATVNRIEVLSTTINATTQQILDNQQNEVHMDTFSG